MKQIPIALAATLAAISLASAQTYMDSKGTVVPGVAPLVGCSAGGNCAGPVSATNPLPVSGSLSATLNGFQPGSAYATPLAASTTSSRVALPAGAVVVVYNTGASAAYVQLGGSSVAATNANDVVPAGGWMAFTVGANTYLAAITSSGTTSLNISGGSGLPTGVGGGSSGSIPTGSAGSPNASVVSVQGVGGGSAVPVSGTFWQTTQPVSLASIPALTAGANTIGAVTQASGPWSVNHTQLNGAALGSPTTWGTAPTGAAVQGVNADVLALPSLPTGANTIGAVTQASGPWSVNHTQLNGAALGSPTTWGTAPTGAAVQGVNADVLALPSLPTGSNTIGAVSVNGNSGAPTQTSVSVATSSTTVLAASTATSFLKLCVALGAANGVWVRWDGATATLAAPAEYIPPGQCDAWVKSTGFLPTSQINAIASATVAVSLIYN
jgi:hypothetical protein